jgi:hypothetical protein
MAKAEQRSERESARSGEPLRELNLWREVGWIFRDGDCIAIERQGNETRARVVVD